MCGSTASLPPPSPPPRARYPGREAQALFFAHYFGARGRPAGLEPARVDALCAEANVFALASHLYWGVWAIVQARPVVCLLVCFRAWSND